MTSIFSTRLPILVTLWFANSLAAQDVDKAWTEFRGPTGNGHALATNLPVDFGDERNLAWKTVLPGRGWSSPVMVDDQIWLTTAIEVQATGDEQAEKMQDADIQGMSAFSRVELKALRLRADTGQLEATIDLFTVTDPPLIHSLNSFASPTAVVDEERVYFHFGTFGTAAVNRKTDAVVWKTSDYPLEHQTGPGSSPILHQGLLILHCDGCDLQYIVALDAETGEQVWRTERSGKLHEDPMYKKAFCTPIVVPRGDQLQLISPAANWVYGYDPETGEELWQLSYGQLGFSNVARPIMVGDICYVCTCYGQSKLMAIDLSGDQPVTEANVKWAYGKQVPNMPSPIAVDGAIYFVNDRGIFTCLDAETGAVNWQSRLRGGFSSSPLYADGKIYLGNQDGEVFVVQPDKTELKILAENPLDAQIMASPAALGQSLYIRTAASLYRFENR